jgi:hypothetical protein
MTSSEGNVAAKSYDTISKFEPDAVLRFWLQSASRIARANQRIITCMMAAGRRQFELAQELGQFRLDAMPTRLDSSTKPEDFGKAQIQRNTQAMDRLIVGMHEVSDEIMRGFSEAVTLLVEDAPTKTSESSAASVSKAVR